MDRREILNELQHIVAITDTVGSDYGIPEASRRAKGLIREVESWPIGFPPAPFASDQCAERQHAKCQLGFSHSRFHASICKCACHGQPEDSYRKRESVLRSTLNAAHKEISAIHQEHPDTKLGYSPEVSGILNAYREADITFENAQEAIQKWYTTPPEAPQQPAEPAPTPERHIDTPDELLELLAGVSSDPQIEGLSLAQKASTMALLYVAKALQEGVRFQRKAMDYLMDKSAAASAPQPIRIFSKYSSRRRHAFRSAVYNAAAANNLARRIVDRASSGATNEEKTVDIALMIREAFKEFVEPPPPAEPDAASPQEPS